MKPLLTKILNVSQIRSLDAFTIENEPVASIDLMERASIAFVKWFTAHFDSEFSIRIFVGPGNNGGDGLAIGRLLSQEKYKVEIYIPTYDQDRSKDFLINYNRLPHNVKRVEINSTKEIEPAKNNTIIIDALLGSGLNRKPKGIIEDVISYINQSGFIIISVDIASGLFADKHTDHSSIVNPNYTISFQIPKLAFFFPDNSKYVGNWQLVDIGLSKKFIEEEKTDSYFLNKNFLKSIYKRRDPFAHKGNYGKALLVSGSYGKMGAAILAARGCLRSGVGLLTVQVPKKGVEILQISVPEAMVVSGKRKKTISEIDWKEFDIDAIAIGPGIGKEDQTLKTLTSLLTEVKKPMVLDADALNLISENPKLLDLIQPNTILTPHFKEFERLVGKSENDFHRISLLRNFAKDKKIFIVLKGKHTAIATPEGDVYFNGTGNPGMATGGSGDVLTGVILSLLAQGYEPLHASLFGVYLHGLAGDIAAKKFGEESLLPSDLINYLGNAFLQINNSY